MRELWLLLLMAVRLGVLWAIRGAASQARLALCLTAPHRLYLNSCCRWSSGGAMLSH